MRGVGARPWLLWLGAQCAGSPTPRHRPERGPHLQRRGATYVLTWPLNRDAMCQPAYMRERAHSGMTWGTTNDQLRGESQSLASASAGAVGVWVMWARHGCGFPTACILSSGQVPTALAPRLVAQRLWGSGPGSPVPWFPGSGSGSPSSCVRRAIPEQLRTSNMLRATSDPTPPLGRRILLRRTTRQATHRKRAAWCARY